MKVVNHVLKSNNLTHQFGKIHVETQSQILLLELMILTTMSFNYSGL